MTDNGVVRRGAAPFVELAVDAGLRVTAWSPRAEQTFGVAAAAAVGRSLAELVPLADGAAWTSLLADDDAAHVWRLASDGRAFEWLHACLYDADDRVCGAHCYGREVTARVAEAGQVALERRLLRAMAQSLNVGVWAIDGEGGFLLYEGRASQAPPGSLVGANIFALPGTEHGHSALREALAGQAKHNFMEMVGSHWESWLVPVRAEEAGGARLLGIALDISDSAQREKELRAQLELIERQQQAIRSMSTPIIEVWERVLCLPILGLVDSVRTAEIMDGLLQAVTRVRARFAILDMTGVDVVDTSTAGHLLGLVRAIELLGAQGIITGIHPNIAQTMVTLGLDLSRLTVHSNLREALKDCLTRMRPK
ncbi:MAG: PAS domain-containing protein [Myxococcales bacterium]|nr:PAS domain-containing protein [Myxococcales bacterium]